MVPKTNSRYSENLSIGIPPERGSAIMCWNCLISYEPSAKSAKTNRSDLNEVATGKDPPTTIVAL